MRVETESGSVYIFDREKKLVRREVRGAASGSERAGSGEWREYLEVQDPVVGFPLLICWRWHNGAIQATVTSPVMAFGEIQ